MSAVSKKVLVLVPAYNEAGNIREVIDEVNREVSTLGLAFDILVVDDGSTDDTSSAAKERNAEVIRLPLNGGIGVALQTGFRFGLEFGYDALVRLDADGQHPPRFIGDILNPVLSDETDLCIGSRFITGQGYQASIVRRLGIAWFSFLIFLLFKRRISDPTSGFQAMNQRLIDLYSKHYASDYPEVEALVTILRKGFKVREVPIAMKERQGGRSSIDWLQSVYYAIKVTTVTFVYLLRK